MDTNDEALAGFLADRVVGCPNCGYNLRGLRSGRCPECDQGLELGIVLAEPAMGSLIASLAALWTAGGGGLAFLFIVTAVSLMFRSFPPAGVYVVPGVGAVVGTIAALVLGRRSGRMWLRSLDAGGRKRVCAACWAFVGLLVVAYIFHLIVVM